jgi:hypothetical protein
MTSRLFSRCVLDGKTSDMRVSFYVYGSGKNVRDEGMVVVVVVVVVGRSLLQLLLLLLSSSSTSQFAGRVCRREGLMRSGVCQRRCGVRSEK